MSTEKENVNEITTATATATSSDDVTQGPQNEAASESFAPDFDSWVTEKPKVDYIKLELGKAKVIRFKSDRPDSMIMSDFNGKSAEKKPVARYMVTTPEEPDKQVAFDVTAKRLASEIKVI